MQLKFGNILFNRNRKWYKKVLPPKIVSPGRPSQLFSNAAESISFTLLQDVVNVEFSRKQVYYMHLRFQKGVLIGHFVVICARIPKSVRTAEPY